MKWKCLIADDEPLARDLIASYVEQVPFLDLVGVFQNAWEVQDFLSKGKVDVLFLDIEMPGLDGLTLVKTTSVNAKIIFTTAHRHYAVDAFEVKAFDYLLKPISFERFLKAVNGLHQIEDKPTTQGPQHFYITHERQQRKIAFDDILYVESKGDYLKIVLQSSAPLLTKMTLKDCMDKLPKNFLQIHRSFVINKKQITAYQKEKVKVGEEWLKISRSFKGVVNNDI